MFKTAKKYYFPELRFQEETTVQHQEKPFRANLYYLDWEKFDSIQSDKFFKWVSECWPNSWDNATNYYIGTVDSKYEKLINQFVFAINSDYLTTIKYHVNEAIIDKSFTCGDTMIRDYCLKAAEAHIDIVFFLIADCLYSRDKGYFEREYPLHYVHSLLLWKFWSRQTGHGLLREKCRINDLEERLSFLKNNKEQEKIAEYYKELISTFDQWIEKKEIEDNKIKLNVDEDGPSLNVDENN